MPRKTSFCSGLIKSRPTYMQFRQIKARRVGELDHLPTVSLQHCLNTWNAHPLFNKGTELRPLLCPCNQLLETLSQEAGRKQTRT